MLQFLYQLYFFVPIWFLLQFNFCSNFCNNFIFLFQFIFCSNFFLYQFFIFVLIFVSIVYYCSNLCTNSIFLFQFAGRMANSEGIDKKLAAIGPLSSNDSPLYGKPPSHCLMYSRGRTSMLEASSSTLHNMGFKPYPLYHLTTGKNRGKTIIY